MPLEKLHSTLALLRLLPCTECTQIASLPSLGVFFREYSRYSPDFSLRIMLDPQPLDAIKRGWSRMSFP